MFNLLSWIRGVVSGIVALCWIAYASAEPIPPSIIGLNSYILQNVQSNAVLASKNPHNQYEPASTVKLMTAYLVFEKLKLGEISLEQTVVISDEPLAAIKQSSSTPKGAEKNKGLPTNIGLYAGQKVQIRDLLYGMMIASANDAAVALAQLVSPDHSEDSFVVEMNNKAQELGMKNTVFTNSSGLGYPQVPVSSAYDLLLLARAVMDDFPEYYSIYSEKSFTFNRQTYRSLNPLVRSGFGDGLKTGHTLNARYNLIASSERDNQRYVLVLLGVVDDKTRENDAERLFRWAFERFETSKIYSAHQAVGTLKVYEGVKNTLPVGVNRDVYLTLEKGIVGTLKVQLEHPKDLFAPIQYGQKVGTLRLVDSKGEVVFESNAIALEDIEQSSWLMRLLSRIGRWFASLHF